MMNKIRPPTKQEVEKIRLILSTYQDGTGMLAQKGGGTLPGWRDFERTVAIVFNGEAQEDKSIFDVLVHLPGSSSFYGLSCKMRNQLKQIERTGRVAFELSNSAGKFWDHLRIKGLNQKNYRKKPEVVGAALLELVDQWHWAVSLEQGGSVDLDRSSYFVLSWSLDGWYRLHQFPIHLPEAATLTWQFPTTRCLKGIDNTGTLIEWYGESGGQLKYYPRAANAIWSSDMFKLEPLQGNEQGIIAKAEAYFPEQWKKISK